MMKALTQNSRRTFTGPCALAGCGLLLALAGCAHSNAVTVAEASGSSAPAAHNARSATAMLVPLGSSGVSGTLTLTELVDGGVKIEGHIHGLRPEGLHGFHVHEKGDCSAADGTSAGGHFNPTGQPHGDPSSQHSHVGDFGNVQANNAGEAEVFTVKKEASLGDDANSLVGRAIIVHKGLDDLASQPAGKSGDRIACAIIRLSR
jgi:Cu-Zn family superoxide dismutase